MKIVIDVSQMAYTGTGVARYLRALVPALFRLGSPHQFVLYAGRLRQGAFFHKLAQEAPWNQVDWCFRPIPPKFAGLLFHTLNIPLETMTGACDLVHTSDWVEPNTRAPKVTTVHDLVFRKYPETVDPLIRFTQSARLHKIIHNHTHIIADSMSTKEDLIKFGMIFAATKHYENKTFTLENIGEAKENSLIEDNLKDPIKKSYTKVALKLVDLCKYPRKI